MTEMVSGGVSYEFVLEDNVTPATDEMVAAQDRLEDELGVVSEGMDEQRRRGIEASASISAYRLEVEGATAEIEQLGDYRQEILVATSETERLNEESARVDEVVVRLRGEADGASATLSGISNASASASWNIDQMAQAEDRLTTSTSKANDQMTRQSVRNLEALASFNGLRSGIREINSSMHELGITDDETYETMTKVVAGITLITSTAETLKSVTVAMNLLTTATKGFAVSSIFAAIAANPLLGVAAVATAGAATYGIVSAMNQGSSSSSTTSSSTTNVNFYSSPDRTERTASSELTTGSYY